MNKQLKTSSYQRKAYKDYVLRNKDDPEFIANRKAHQKKYYEKNKIKIIAKVKARQEKLKNMKSQSSSIIITFD
tara:strand:- start:2158 stop:2379 length:222 start_codon:yes stop_codon:yes gene_type:complete